MSSCIMSVTRSLFCFSSSCVAYLVCGLVAENENAHFRQKTKYLRINLILLSF